MSVTEKEGLRLSLHSTSENPIRWYFSAVWYNQQLFTNETACRRDGVAIEVIERWQAALADYIANGVCSQ